MKLTKSKPKTSSKSSFEDDLLMFMFTPSTEDLDEVFGFDFDDSDNVIQDEADKVARGWQWFSPSRHS